MKILVTGGAGFIASHIVDGYIEAGHEVVVVDDLSVGKQENLNPNAIFYQVDIVDFEALKTVFEKEKPEAINHHAAQKFLRRSVEFPGEDATINIIGSLNLLQLAKQYGCKRFIFASTAAAYGDLDEQMPYKESFKGQPIAPYGVAKRSVEDYMYTFNLNDGLSTITLRYSNVFGPRQDAHGESGVIAIFAEKLIANEPITINGTGEQTRDYVYIGDVVRANVLALESELTGVVNISTNTEVSLLTLLTELSERVGVTQQPTHGPAKKGDPDRVVLDNAAALKQLNWQPNTSFAEGLTETVDWFTAKLN